MSEKYKIGDYVTNPNVSVWGPGIVLDVQSAKVTVYFRDCFERPVRTIATNIIELDIAPIRGDLILDNLPPYDSEDGKLTKRRVTHEEGVKMFADHFPLLFEDPTYFGDRKRGERAYKMEAHDIFTKLLGNGKGKRLVEAGDSQELFKRLFAVEGLLNLLSPYEKMALKDALCDEKAALPFYSALFNVIDMDTFDEDAFQALIVAVNNLPHDEGKAKVATWPVLTQFPFIARPDCHMFLKPEVTKACAERMVFELNYRSQLNWVTYYQLIKMARMLFEKLEPMGAKDYIDVQSYIWVIGAYE